MAASTFYIATGNKWPNQIWLPQRIGMIHDDHRGYATLLPTAKYFRLAEADVVCILDCVQFPRRGWVHRNRLPGVAGHAHWLTLPLAKGPINVRIADLRFAEDAEAALETFT